LINFEFCKDFLLRHEHCRPCEHIAETGEISDNPLQPALLREKLGIFPAVNGERLPDT
jgi:hypothetical protein